MRENKFTERKERVKAMNKILQKLYPNVEIELNYSNSWELLVAVILSAQCTDARVNRVTESLFAQYKTVCTIALLSRLTAGSLVLPVSERGGQ